MKRIKSVVIICLMFVILAACSGLGGERVKLQDLDFTVLSEEKIPAELLTIMKEKGPDPFQLTYHDKEYWYLCVGYGEQPTGGYSIAVNELYLTENAIYVSTELLGPESGEEGNRAPSYPCIVIKTKYIDATVLFE